MDNNQFAQIKDRFRTSDTQGKIDIYVSSTGLSNSQYKELLTLYPISELARLENALK